MGTAALIREGLAAAGYDILIRDDYDNAPAEHVEKIVAALIRKETSKTPKSHNSNRCYRGNVAYKRMLLEAQNHRCCYCGVHLTHHDPHGPNHSTFEHVDNLRDGGKDSIHNLVIACQFCNQDRASTNLSAEGYYEWVVEHRKRHDKKRRQREKIHLEKASRKGVPWYLKEFKPIYG